MRLGFPDADDLRARHEAFRRRQVLERAVFAQIYDGAYRAVEASWATLARSKSMVEHADRFARQREIVTLADELVEQQRALMAKHDDGAILGAIFPPRRPR